MASPHRVWCTISLSALRSNLRALRRSCPRGTQILAVVKDNAYGHGLIPVARTLAQAGCEEFGVACAAEGEELRGAGIRNPILLLGSTLPSEFSVALQHRLTITLSSMAEARELAQAAERIRKTALVQVKLDTGMNRLGARPPEFQKLVSFVAHHPRLDWWEPSPIWPVPTPTFPSPGDNSAKPPSFPNSWPTIGPIPPPFYIHTPCPKPMPDPVSASTASVLYPVLPRNFNRFSHGNRKFFWSVRFRREKPSATAPPIEPGAP